MTRMYLFLMGAMVMLIAAPAMAQTAPPNPTAVPEPATALTAIIGAAFLYSRGGRRKRD